MRVLGKEMILWVVDSLKLAPEDTLVVVYNPNFLDMKELMEMVVAHRPGAVLVELAGPTRGAAETVRFGLEGLAASRRSRPTMLVDGDAFYTVESGAARYPTARRSGLESRAKTSPGCSGARPLHAQRTRVSTFGYRAGRASSKFS